MKDNSKGNPKCVNKQTMTSTEYLESKQFKIGRSNPIVKLKDAEIGRQMAYLEGMIEALGATQHTFTKGYYKQQLAVLKLKHGIQ